MDLEVVVREEGEGGFEVGDEGGVMMDSCGCDEGNSTECWEGLERWVIFVDQREVATLRTDREVCCSIRQSLMGN